MAIATIKLLRKNGKYKANVDLVQNLYEVKSLKAIKRTGDAFILNMENRPKRWEVPYDRRLIPTKYGLIMFWEIKQMSNLSFTINLATNEYELLSMLWQVRNLNWQMELTKRLHPTINRISKFLMTTGEGKSTTIGG